jgi:hypothetical protein
VRLVRLTYENVYAALIPSLLALSVWTYVTGDAILHIMSYQGPIVAGGMLGWLAVMRANSGKQYSPSINEEMLPILGLILRKYAILPILVGSAIFSVWLLPQYYALEVSSPLYYVASFVSEVIGGFLVGIAIPSLKFIEKVVLYSLGLGMDLFYVYLIYLSAGIFHLSSDLVLNYALAMVFVVKFPEGVTLGLYIAKKVRVI